tara:strand:- start:4698 stop:5174 length:477 start_codon:yes stop_codon:yes gene_type:complete
MSHTATYAEIKQILRESKRITNNVLLKVAKLAIAETLGERADEIETEIVWDSKLGDDLMLDSLDMVELVMFLEECFSIEIPDEDAVDIVTIGDALEVIKRNRKKSPKQRKKIDKRKYKKKTQPVDPSHSPKFAKLADAAAEKQAKLDAEIEKALEDEA